MGQYPVIYSAFSDGGYCCPPSSNLSAYSSDGSHFPFSTSGAEPIDLAIGTFATEELKCCQENTVWMKLVKPLKMRFYIQSYATNLEKGKISLTFFYSTP